MLFILSFLISIQFESIVSSPSRGFLGLNLNFFLNLVVLLTLLSFVYTFSIGTWESKWHLAYIPLSIALGMFAIVAPYNLLAGIIVLFTACVLIFSDTYNSTKMKENLITFDPILIMKTSIRNILLIFSLLAAVIAMINTKGRSENAFANQITTMAETQIDSILSNKDFQTYINNLTLGMGNSLNLGPVEKNIIEKNMPLTDLQDKVNQNSSDPNQNTAQEEQLAFPKEEIKAVALATLNKYIKPYSQLLFIAFSAVLFGFVQTSGTAAYIIYAMLARPFIKLLLALGIFKEQTKTVEQKTIILP